MRITDNNTAANMSSTTDRQGCAFSGTFSQSPRHSTAVTDPLQAILTSIELYVVLQNSEQLMGLQPQLMEQLVWPRRGLYQM